MVYLYHEKQKDALCGQHALNSLLQGPYFTEIDLAQIAQELDALEQSFMAESGMDSKAYRDWQAEGSGNVAADGMFSIQVLGKALEHWNLSCTNLDSPEATESKAHPEDEQAFICNLQEHWLTIRQISGSWYNFNSLYPAPEFLGTLYLTAFLATLREQGYSIFVVKGRLPNLHPDAGSPDTAGKWFTPQQAKVATKGAVKAREAGYLKAVLSDCMDKASPEGTMVTLKPKAAASGAWASQNSWGQPENGAADGQDDDLARAIAASLGQDAALSKRCSTAGPSGVDAAAATDAFDDDPELAAALAASMADSQAGAGPSSEAREQEAADLAAARLAALDPGPEPPAGAGTLDIALRLPDGNRLMRRFRSSERIHDVLNFLRWKGVQVQGLVLTAQFPRKVFSDSQETLGAAGISNMETLNLQAK